MTKRSYTTVLVKVSLAHPDDAPTSIVERVLEKTVSIASDAIKAQGYDVVEQARTKTVTTDA